MFAGSSLRRDLIQPVQRVVREPRLDGADHTQRGRGGVQLAPHTQQACHHDRVRS